MDVLLVGARVCTMDPRSRGDAVAVRDGVIADVGDRHELRGAYPAASIIDLSGCVLLPGFHDTHTHFFELARRRAGVDLSNARTADDVRAELRRKRDGLTADQLWVGGSGWDMNAMSATGQLDRALLDEIFPDRPIALEARDFHTLWCNTKALELAGVFEGAAAPPGGEIGRRPDGEPDGLLYETAWDLIWRVRPVESSAVAEAWLEETIEYAHSLGLTGVHCMEVQSTYDHYRRLADDDRLPLRLCFHSPLDRLDERIEAGIVSYESDEPWLRYGGVKIFMDGSLGSRSAFMHSPYPDGSRGRLLRSEEELDGILRRAADAGIAGSVHAIGDATVDLVARSFRRLRESGHRDLLLRIEHAQCVTPSTVAELAELDVYCAMQLVHLVDDIPLLPREWGEVSRHAYPVRSLQAAGVTVGLGSDAPVATLDPRAGIAMACLRSLPDGANHEPRQAMTLERALAGYTIDAARGSRRQAELGSITVGKYADLVAFDDVGEDAGAWLDTPTRLTMVQGRVVFENLP